MKLSLSALEIFLKKQCDALRTSMDAAEYKDYIIAMIFIKWANDNFVLQQKKYAEKLRKEDSELTEEEIQSEIEENNSSVYSFFVPVEARWKVESLPEFYKEKVANQIKFSKLVIEDKSKSQSEKKEAKEKIEESNSLMNWKGLLYCPENVGMVLNRALKQLEAANSSTLDGVLKSINFNKLNGKGERILSDELLYTMIKDFNDYIFTEDNFEFPDLLGAAYEYLLKFFAESAGKKGGEFYTPAPVVELMGKILQPAENASICDPTVGSGGLLINMKNFVEARYGTAKNLFLCGQELIDGTYKMCKMNMLFHSITDANIQLGDTLLHPKHVHNGKLDKFDIVVANPPFSQNYTKKEMEYQDRFAFWMSTKKQADFMFVQHMVSVLKDDGRMAVIMPHGVLFRGGAEQAYRRYLITNGLLESVIGLPQALFYGTGIPASILIINKKDSEKRNGVFFINADREYKEGKNQNILRPEDVEKISYVYLNKREINGYSRFVSKEELESESFNCNIRRYVDNAPPAEKQDVYAHLHGGIPKKEIEALESLTSCYGDVVSYLFDNISNDYLNFKSEIKSKEDIKTNLFEFKGYKFTREAYNIILFEFWEKASDLISQLPVSKDVYDLQKKLASMFSLFLGKKQYPVLDEYQSRGAFAQYLEDLKSDFKSISASGWNSTLIPDDVILESQASDILEKLKADKARIEEINSYFEEVAIFDSDDCEEEFDESMYEVLPKGKYQELSKEKKGLDSQLKALKKENKENEKRLKAYQKDTPFVKGGCLPSADRGIFKDNLVFDNIAIIKNLIENNNSKIQALESQISDIETKLKHNVDLENEKKALTKDINATEKRLSEIAEVARQKIDSESARKLILDIGYQRLYSTIQEYLDAHIRKLQGKIEEIYDKYTVTLGSMIDERDKAVNELDSFLKQMNYL